MDTGDSGRTFDENLGVPSAPQIDADTGNIFIEYTNGTSPCGTDDFWSTRIDFICATDDSAVCYSGFEIVLN